MYQSFELRVSGIYFRLSHSNDFDLIRTYFQDSKLKMFAVKVWSTRRKIITSMTIRELKEEIHQFGIETKSMLEKWEFQKSLDGARANGDRKLVPFNQVRWSGNAELFDNHVFFLDRIIELRPLRDFFCKDLGVPEHATIRDLGFVLQRANKRAQEGHTEGVRECVLAVYFELNSMIQRVRQARDHTLRTAFFVELGELASEQVACWSPSPNHTLNHT